MCKKVEYLCSSVSLFSELSVKGEQFYVYREKMNVIFLKEKEDGIANLSEDVEIGVDGPYQMFLHLARNITPNSVDCERCFNLLTRLCSKFCRKLERHLPTLLRCRWSIP